jgi:cytoskeletal protein CcmA (bactofilin family)
MTMWWEKKTRPEEEPPSIRHDEVTPAPPAEEKPMSEPTPKHTNTSATGSQRTLLGRTVVAQGQIISGEDLLIEGQFDGTITLNDHCLTVGSEGRVKAEIRARQVIIQGAVTGNIEAREKIDIRRTGHVVGDLVAATVAIEDGAYFKGSIDIARDEGAGAASGAFSGK